MMNVEIGENLWPVMFLRLSIVNFILPMNKVSFIVDFLLATIFLEKYLLESQYFSLLFYLC